MFVIDSYIDISEEDRVQYKVYGIYNSKEQAIEALDELNKYFQNNYADNIISIWNLHNRFIIEFTYIDPDDVDFEQIAILSYEIKEISTPDSILNTTPNDIGAFIHNTMFPDND